MADDYSLNTDGTITFEFEGLTRVLKRPTLKQYRGVIEALGTLRDDFLTESGEIKTTTISVQLDVLIGWLDKVFATLAGEGLPRVGDQIDEDKLPSWLLSNEVIQDMIQHWQTVPNRRGSR